jgi:hypothetical protein
MYGCLWSYTYQPLEQLIVAHLGEVVEAAEGHIFRHIIHSRSADSLQNVKFCPQMFIQIWQQILYIIICFLFFLVVVYKLGKLFWNKHLLTKTIFW